MELESIKIRKYDPKEHKEVLDLVIKGLSSHQWTAYQNTYNGQKIQPILVRMFLHFWLWQLFSNGFVLFASVVLYEVALFYAIKYYCIGGYLRDSVHKLMSDPELSYYTTKPTDIFLVAIDTNSDEVVGCIAGTKMEDRDSMRLHRMIVHPDNQRRGLGKRLIEALFQHVRSRSGKEFTTNSCPQSVFLETTDSQQPAIKLYQHCGFVWIGSRPKTCGPPFPFSFIMHSIQILAFSINLCGK